MCSMVWWADLTAMTRAVASRQVVLSAVSIGMDRPSAFGPGHEENRATDLGDLGGLGHRS